MTSGILGTAAQRKAKAVNIVICTFWINSGEATEAVFIRSKIISNILSAKTKTAVIRLKAVNISAYA
jgi:hypothetical protein